MTKPQIAMKTENIDSIVIHCSDTPYMQDVKAADIDKFHKKKGWKMIGQGGAAFRAAGNAVGDSRRDPGAQRFRQVARSPQVVRQTNERKQQQ